MEIHQVRHGRCRNDDAFHNFNFANAQLIYCEYRPHRNMSFCRPHPSSHATTTPICTLMPHHPNCGGNWTKHIAAIMRILFWVVGMSVQPDAPISSVLCLPCLRRRDGNFLIPGWCATAFMRVERVANTSITPSTSFSFRHVPHKYT